MKGICRGICFIATASLSACYVNNLSLWIVILAGAVIGITAGIGWED